MNQLEHIGTLYVETQRLLGEYQKLLGLVQQIKNGEVQPDRIRVDLERASWAIEITGPELAKAMADGNAT
jgi:hypothetical protein